MVRIGLYLVVMTFLPALAESNDLRKAECEDVYAFPKIYGKNGS
jgi:hypothetical protein